MDDRRFSERLTVRQMLLMFIGGVVVCAVFFALGFLVGYNQRPQVAAAETEQIQAPSAIPPTVNPPPDSSPAQQDSVNPSSPPASLPASPSPSAAQPAARSTPASAIPADQPETEVINRQAPAPASAPAKAAHQPAGSAQSASVPGASKPVAGMMLQVVALKYQQDADEVDNLLKSRGYTAFLVSPQEARAGDNLWRVLVGPFRTRAQAERARRELAQQGYHPFIKR